MSERTEDDGAPAGRNVRRLDLLKALGDNTRYAIYLELARAPAPLSTADIADTLGLHANTVRPHLERMRDVGLLEVRAATTGGVGRPQHLYTLAPDAPSLGLEPPVYPMIARMLLQLLHDAAVDPEVVLEVGREQGARDAAIRADGLPCVDAAMAELDALGFDPARVDDADGTTVVAFTHCPFHELAQANPELVCSLHRGILAGFVDAVGGATMVDFHDLTHREPCQVQLAATS